MKYASLISLGCAKNLVDSEQMVKQLLDIGYTMTAEAAEAELIVVNTCGFLESAVQEAIEAILEAAAHKRSGKCRMLVAAGCMVQRYGKKLLEELPEVDILPGDLPLSCAENRCGIQARREPEAALDRKAGASSRGRSGPGNFDGGLLGVPQNCRRVRQHVLFLHYSPSAGATQEQAGSRHRC